MRMPRLRQIQQSRSGATAAPIWGLLLRSVVLLSAAIYRVGLWLVGASCRADVVHAGDEHRSVRLLPGSRKERSLWRALTFSNSRAPVLPCPRTLVLYFRSVSGSALVLLGYRTV